MPAKRQVLPKTVLKTRLKQDGNKRQELKSKLESVNPFRGMDVCVCDSCEQKTGEYDRNGAPGKRVFLHWTKTTLCSKKKKMKPYGKECHPCRHVRQKFFKKKLLDDKTETQADDDGEPPKSKMKTTHGEEESGTDDRLKPPMSQADLIALRHRAAEMDSKFWELRADFVSGEKKFVHQGSEIVTHSVSKVERALDQEFVTGAKKPIVCFARDRNIQYDSIDELAEYVIKKYPSYNICYDRAGELVVEVPDQPEGETRFKRGKSDETQLKKYQLKGSREEAKESFEVAVNKKVLKDECLQLAVAGAAERSSSSGVRSASANGDAVRVNTPPSSADLEDGHASNKSQSVGSTKTAVCRRPASRSSTPRATSKKSAIDDAVSQEERQAGFLANMDEEDDEDKEDADESTKRLSSQDRCYMDGNICYDRGLRDWESGKHYGKVKQAKACAKVVSSLNKWGENVDRATLKMENHFRQSCLRWPTTSKNDNDSLRLSVKISPRSRWRPLDPLEHAS